MDCDCSKTSAHTEAEQKTIRVALSLNATMFVVGIVTGILAQSTGILSDALDMLIDAAAYGLALMAITRGSAFKANAARWSGWILVLLGGGILAEVVRRWYSGSEPIGTVMLAYSVVSFAVNLYVLVQLARYRRGEIHLRASYICTRADVLANVAVFISGGVVLVTGYGAADLVVGFAVGLYVVKEAIEILREANEASSSSA